MGRALVLYYSAYGQGYKLGQPAPIATVAELARREIPGRARRADRGEAGEVS